MEELAPIIYMKYEAVLNNSTAIDYGNNNFIEHGTEYCTLRNETETVWDSSLTNLDKGSWQISIYPLPDIVKALPAVDEDCIYCAASVALWKRVEMVNVKKNQAYYEATNSTDQISAVSSFTGFA